MKSCRFTLTFLIFGIGIKGKGRTHTVVLFRPRLFGLTFLI